MIVMMMMISISKLQWWCNIIIYDHDLIFFSRSVTFISFMMKMENDVHTNKNLNITWNVYLWDNVDWNHTYWNNLSQQQFLSES